MREIWLSTDLHLFSKDNDYRHPFRTDRENSRLADNFSNEIDSSDLFIFLGDLCDPGVSDPKKLGDVIKSIPCYKIMCRGNHDTQDDLFYREVGFDLVIDICRYHNIIFSHKPIRVQPDELNIHGHLHTEMMSGLGPNHINAYADNWHNNGHPIRLSDLINAATVQSIEIPKKDMEHIQDKFQKYTSLDYGEQYKSFADITDWDTDQIKGIITDAGAEGSVIISMSEAAINTSTIPKAILDLHVTMTEEYNYGIPVNGKVEPGKEWSPSDYDMMYRISSPRQFQKQKGGVCWDYVLYEADWFSKNLPRVPYKAYYVMFDDGVVYPTHTFLAFQVGHKHFLFEVSYDRIAGIWSAPDDSHFINFIMDTMKEDNAKLNLKRAKYYVCTFDPLDPRYVGMSCVEFMDAMANWGIDQDHKYQSNYSVIKYDPLVESADLDTMMDEVVFGHDEGDSDADVENWMVDDEHYKNKLRKSQSERENTVVATESVELEVPTPQVALMENISALESELNESSGKVQYDILLTKNEYGKYYTLLLKQSNGYIIPLSSKTKNSSEIQSICEYLGYTTDGQYVAESSDEDMDDSFYDDKGVHHIPVVVKCTGEAASSKKSYSQYAKFKKDAEWFTIHELDKILGTYCEGGDEYSSAVFSAEDTLWEKSYSQMNKGDKMIARYMAGRNLKQKLFGMRESVEEPLDEAVWVSEPDIEMNLNDWKPNGKNFLFIGGLSASGKTTQANAMGKKYKVEVIHLDDLAQASFVGKMSNPNFIDRMSPTMQEYWNSTTDHITMYRWGDQRIGLETDKFMKWMIKNHTSDSKRYIIEGCEVWYIDPDYLIHQPLIIKGTSAMKTVAYRFKRTYGQHRDKGESLLDAFTHCMSQLGTILKNGSMIAAENTLEAFKRVLKAAQDYEASVITETAAGTQYPNITVKVEKTENPNDNVSKKAVHLTFFNDKKQEVGEVSISAIDSKTPFIYDLEVKSEFRRQHYGDAIVDYIVKRYRASTLGVEKSNAAAIALYKKHGFKVTQEYKDSNRDLYYMEFQKPKTLQEMAYEDAQDTMDPLIRKYCRDFDQDKYLTTIAKQWKKDGIEDEPPRLKLERTMASERQLLYVQPDLSPETYNNPGAVASYWNLIKHMSDEMWKELQEKKCTCITRLNPTAEDVVGIYVDVNYELNEASNSLPPDFKYLIPTAVSSAYSHLYGMEHGVDRYPTYIFKNENIYGSNPAVPTSGLTPAFKWNDVDFSRYKTIDPMGYSDDSYFIYDATHEVYGVMKEFASYYPGRRPISDNECYAVLVKINLPGDPVFTFNVVNADNGYYLIDPIHGGMDTAHNTILVPVAYFKDINELYKYTLLRIIMDETIRPQSYSLKSNMVQLYSYIPGKQYYKLSKDDFVKKVISSGKQVRLPSWTVSSISNGPKEFILYNIVQNQSTYQSELVPAKVTGNIVNESAEDDTTDPTLKKHGLRDVGNTHEVEREEEEIRQRKEKARQMKELQKKHDKALAEKKKEAAKKHKIRMKAAKKARKTRLKNQRLKAKQSTVPGVKNEDFDLLDPILTVDTDNHHSPVLEMIDHVQFFDRMDETSTVKVEKIKPVYIFLTHTGTKMSEMIKKFTHDEFTHSSISFDSSMSACYTFANKQRMPDRPITKMGGFQAENLRSGFYEHRDCPWAIFMVPCTESQIKQMKKRLDYFIKNDVKFTYNVAGLATNLLGVSYNPEWSFFCSQFVADILNAGKPNKPYEDPSLVKPNELQNIPQAIEVLRGNTMDDFDPKKLEMATRRLLNQKKIQKLANESVLDIPSDNLYEIDILNYQLTYLNESMEEEFFGYLTEFKVRFDQDGNILVTRREYDTLSKILRSTVKKIEQAEDESNLSTVKDLLFKLNYMASLIEQYYLRPLTKNQVDRAKDVRDDMVVLRGMVLDQFTRHMNWITAREPYWNYSREYGVSRYGDPTKVHQKVLGSISTAIMSELK